jgi:uncharacterized protein (DUF58 family)
MALTPQLDDLLELRHGAHALGLAAHHRVNSALAGLYASVFRGQGMDYEETREYREGDDIRNMDWRVTARTGSAHLKVFREERERPVILCVDCGPHMQFGTRGTFKSVQAARTAALLGWSASGNQDRVGGLLFGAPYRGLRYFRPSRSRQSLWRLLRALTEPVEVASDGGDPLLETLDKLQRMAPTGALLFVIADFNRDPSTLHRALGRLGQRHELVLLPVDDPADRDIPQIGRVMFQTVNGTRIEINTDSEQGRRQYHETWERNRQALIQIASRLGIALIPVPTDQDIHQTLLVGLRQRLRGSETGLMRWHAQAEEL